MKRFKSLISLSLVLCMVLSLFSPVTVFAEDAVLPEEPVAQQQEQPLVEEPSEEPVEEPTETPVEEPVQEEPAQQPAEEPEISAPVVDAPEEDIALDLLASTDIASGLCGTNLTWALDANGVLTISGTGDMYDYQYNNQPWSSYHSSIQKIVVEEGVTSVGDYAFYQYNATEITLPKTLTAIGYCAFQHCRYVTEITIPGTITSWEGSSFYDCTRLTTFTLAGCETAVPSSAFNSCSMLTTVSLPEGVTQIGSDAFSNCTKLASINIPSTVTAIGYSAFDRCTSLTAIDIPGSVVSISSYAFDGCTALETVDLGSGLEGIYPYAFRNCSSLTELELPDRLTSIGESAFYACTGLESVDFGHGIQTVGDNAFYSCTGLTELELPDSLQTISANAFRDCISVETVTIGSGIRTIGDAAFGGCSALQTVDIDYYEDLMTVDADAFPAAVTVTYLTVTPDSVLEEWDEGDYTATLYADGRLKVSGDEIEEFGSSSQTPWYAHRNKISRLTLEDGLTRIGSYAFCGFTSLTEVTIPDSVETIGYSAFQSCSALETVTIGSGIQTIQSQAFYNCSALTSISMDVYTGAVSISYDAIPTGVTVNYRTGTSAEVAYRWEVGAYDETTVTATLYADGRLVFEGVGAVSSTKPWSNYSAMITAVHVGNGVTKLPSAAFQNCSNLKTVTGMADVTSVPDSAFHNCSSLTSVELGNHLTSIDYRAFSHCTALASINLPENLTNISDDAFAYCTSLTEVIIPDSVTYIYNDAFNGCTALKELSVGSGLYRLDDRAFYGCTALEIIHWNVQSLNYSNLSTGSHIFYNAGTKGSGITVNIGADVQSIPDYLFYVSSAYEGCQPKIKKVTLADDAQLGSIGNFAFYRLTELESVELGDKLTVIGDGAFNTCSALTEIDLPDTLSSIGARAFYRTGLKSVTISDQVYSIGENAFGEITDPDFTIYGEAGSQAHIYASSENIPFNAYVRSGSQDGIDWTFDEQTGQLTLTGSGTSALPIADAPWDRYLNNATEIVIGSGITTLKDDAFGSLDSTTQIYTLTIGEDVTEIAAGAIPSMHLAEVTFEGDQPAVTGGGSPFSHGTTVYYPASANWTDLSWPSSTFYALTGQDVTLTFHDNYAGTSKKVTVTVEGGRPVYLQTYSNDALNRYQQVHSDAYLKSWNTAADGSGTSYATDETAVFTQNTDLYAQWPAYYTVKLNENNGLGTQTVSVREGDYLYLYNYHYDVQDRYQQTMPGASLSHWSTKADGTGEYYSAYSSYYITGDLTLYAQWSLPDYVSVTFHDNNSYYPDKTVSVSRHISGYGLSLTDYTEQAQARYRAYDLTMAISGWNTKADGTGDSYAADETVYPTADLVLYAQWDLAADQVIASGDDGDIHWDLYSFGTLILSGDGEMPNYSYRGTDTPWYDYRTQIKKIVMESGLSSVGSYAFYDCTALTEVSLPDTLDYIGSSAFYNCPALQTVTIDTYEMLVDNNYTFADTVTVTWKTSTDKPLFTWDISEDDYDDDEVVNKVTAKLYGNGLLEISGKGQMEVDDWWSDSYVPWSHYRSWIKEVRVLSGVTNVGDYAFYRCSNLTTVSLPDTLTMIGSDVFYNCPSLTAINIDTYELFVEVNCTFPASAVVTWKTATSPDAILKVWHIGDIDETDITATLYANGHLELEGTGAPGKLPWPCKITSVTVGEGITGLTAGAFSGRYRLTQVLLPSTLESIADSAFSGCEALTSITVPAGVESIADFAFEGCTALTSVQLPAALRSIGDCAFYNCSALTEIAIPAMVESIGSEAFYGCKALTSMDLPDTLTDLGSSAFMNCTALTTVTGLQQVSSIRSSTFRGCTALTSVGPITAATSVGNYAFKNCAALTDITFSDNLTRIGSQAFFGCKALKSVTFGENLTEIRDQAFENCESLASITLPDSVTNIQHRAFAGCTGLTTLTVGEGLTNLGSEAFDGCTGLKQLNWNAEACDYLNESYFVFRDAGKTGGGFTLTIGPNVEIIPAYLFHTSQLEEGHHPRLKTVKLSGKSSLTEVGDFAFYRCLELDSVDLGDKLTAIRQGAFNTCAKLTEIDLPATLQHVGRKAFFRTGLTTAELGWDVQEIGADAFAECASGFYLQGYDGSAANLHADAYGIPFTAYPMSGTDNGVHWNLDLLSGKLTFSGSGTITTDGGWADHAKLVTGIVIENGITGLENPAFRTCTNLQTVLFMGDAPVLTNTTLDPFADSDLTVYCLEGFSGWGASAGYEVEWNGHTVQVISLEISDLSIQGFVNHFSYSTTLSENKGTWIDLTLYSKDIQTKYNRTASDANLVAWNTAADGSGKSYGLTDLFRMGDADNLFAQWQVFIQGHLSLADYVFGTYQKVVYDYYVGTPITLTPYSQAAQNNYNGRDAELIGWNTQPDGSGTAYGPNDTYYITDNGSLFAQWKTFTMGVANLIDQRFGTYWTTVEDRVGTTIELTPHSQAVQSSYYQYASDANLVGWNTQPDGSGTAYGPNDTYSMTENGSLYAQWYKPERHTVTFYGNHFAWSTNHKTMTGNSIYLGEYSDMAQAICWSEYDGDAILTGWNTASDGTGTAYGQYDVLTVTGDLELYAQWQIPQRYTLTLEGNGCDWNRTRTVIDGQGFDLRNDSYSVQEYYRNNVISDAIFTGWSTTRDGSGGLMGGDVMYYPNGDITLYAQWQLPAATQVASGKCGSNLKWTLDSHGQLTITGTGAMMDFDDSDGMPWYQYRSDIRTVTVDEGITRIGRYAFWNHYNLNTLDLPDSLVSIGQSAFYSCDDLTEVTLGSNIRTVDQGAFYNCGEPFTVHAGVSEPVMEYYHKAYAELSNYYYDLSFPEDTIFFWQAGSDTAVANVWDIGSYDETDVTATLYTSGRLVIQGKGGFDESPWGNHITSVEIGEGITSIGESAFEDCIELVTVTTPQTLTEVDNYAFQNCYSLEKVTNLSNVTYFGWYAFRNCVKLTEVDLSSAEEIRWDAFYGSGITEADLSNINEIGSNAFENCQNLTSITVGEDLDWVEELAFANCPKLTTVYWQCSNDIGLSAESNLFLNSGVKSNRGIRLYAYSEHIPAYLFYTGSSYAGQEPALTAIYTSTKYGSPVTIGEFAFYRAIHLKTVKALDEIEMIGDGAFNSCSSLTDIQLGDNLHTLGAKAFFRTGLTSFTAGRNLETIGEDAFAQCPTGFFLQGYTDSQLYRYASKHAIPFVPMSTSGIANGIRWSFDEATGTLSLTGSGAVTTAPWEHLASQVEHITLSEGITELGSSVFAGIEVQELTFPATLTKFSDRCISWVETAYFLGALPEVDVNSRATELPFSNIYYLQGSAGWEDCDWADEYDCNEPRPFSTVQGTMTLVEDTQYYTHNTAVTDYIGTQIYLKNYSGAAQERYYEYASDANLVGWTDGVNNYTTKSSVPLKDGLTLTAQWKTKTFTIDGAHYPVTKDAAGSGWSYSDYVLTLDGYNGGSIDLPAGVNLVAQGTNTVNDLISGHDTVFTVKSGVTTIAATGEDNTALDFGVIEVIVEEGAVLNISSQFRIFSSVDSFALTCDGTANFTAADTCALRGSEVCFHGSGTITIQAAKQAIWSKSDVWFTSSFDKYLSPDATEPAAKYETTDYLRLEGSKWSVTLDANGGAWTDGSASAKLVSIALGEGVSLRNYTDLLTRDGYVLMGWSDLDNTFELGLTDWVEYDQCGNTLYAVWEKDLLTVDGKTFAIDAPASGTGWNYAPSYVADDGSTFAVLTISEGYSGKPIAFTRNLDVVITADTVITGTAGVPAISAKGDLTLTIENGDVTVTGGSGQHAVHAGGTLSLYNDGRTTLSGGSGGSGIRAYNLDLHNTGTLTVTGGIRAYAVQLDNTMDLYEVSGITTLVGGEGRNAAYFSGWFVRGTRRFYAGQNASDLTRTTKPSMARNYPYFRIQPKLVVVNLDANGGAINGSQTATLSLLQSDDNSILLLSQTTPVRTGYLFTGWNTRADGSGTAYLEGESYVVKEDATLNLFAQWEELNATFETGTSGQSQLTVDIPEELPAVVETASVLVSCYDKLTGRMLATAFGTKEQTRWVFDIAKQANAEWTMFFLDDKTSYAPIFEALDLNVR